MSGAAAGGRLEEDVEACRSLSLPATRGAPKAILPALSVAHTDAAVEPCLWLLSAKLNGHLVLDVRQKHSAVRQGAHLIERDQLLALSGLDNVVWLYAAELAKARWESLPASQRRANMKAGRLCAKRRARDDGDIVCVVPAACYHSGIASTGAIKIDRVQCPGFFILEELRLGLRAEHVLDFLSGRPQRRAAGEPSDDDDDEPAAAEPAPEPSAQPSAQPSNDACHVEQAVALRRLTSNPAVSRVSVWSGRVQFIGD